MARPTRDRKRSSSPNLEKAADRGSIGSKSNPRNRPNLDKPDVEKGLLGVKVWREYDNAFPGITNKESIEVGFDDLLKNNRVSGSINPQDKSANIDLGFGSSKNKLGGGLSLGIDFRDGWIPNISLDISASIAGFGGGIGIDTRGGGSLSAQVAGGSIKVATDKDGNKSLTFCYGVPGFEICNQYSPTSKNPSTKPRPIVLGRQSPLRNKRPKLPKARIVPRKKPVAKPRKRPVPQPRPAPIPTPTPAPTPPKPPRPPTPTPTPTPTPKKPVPSPRPPKPKRPTPPPLPPPISRTFKDCYPPGTMVTATPLKYVLGVDSIMYFSEWAGVVTPNTKWGEETTIDYLYDASQPNSVGVVKSIRNWNSEPRIGKKYPGAWRAWDDTDTTASIAPPRIARFKIEEFLALKIKPRGEPIPWPPNTQFAGQGQAHWGGETWQIIDPPFEDCPTINDDKPPTGNGKIPRPKSPSSPPVPRLPNQPTKIKPMNCCDKVEEIYKFLGIAKMKKHKFKVAKAFLSPGGTGNEECEDYYALAQALFRMLANGLILNPIAKPLGSEWKSTNATAWAGDMYEMMAESMSDGNSTQKYEIAMMMQVTQLLSIIAESSRKIELIIDAAGYEPIIQTEEIAACFTVYEGHKGFEKKSPKKIDISKAKTDNEVEAVMGRMLKPSKIPITKWVLNPESKSIVELFRGE